MKLAEFLEQEGYCRQENTPEGKGCDNCPTKDREHCADALRNLCGRWLDSLHTDKREFDRCAKQLERVYGLGSWCQLSLVQGFIEFPE